MHPRRTAAIAALALAAGALTVYSWSDGSPPAAAEALPARGATMPYAMYEAEDGATGGGARVVGPNRTVGDLAGEASGRRAVTLDATGAYVEWKLNASTNTLVTRFSIPDGTTGSVAVYVDGTLDTTLKLTSKYAWLYGDETNPQNSGSDPRHIYDEANTLLTGTAAAGSTIRLQNVTGTALAIDFVNTEQVAPIANPDPAAYVVPAGFSQQAVQNALDNARQDSTKAGVYLPPGDYPTTTKFQIYGRSVRVIGAGPWYTRFRTPDDQSNTDAGFRADSSANGSTFADFAYFGNYNQRIDGPGKVFDWQNVAGMTIDNVWAEHVVCLYWGQNTDRVTIRNSRIRDTFADGVNMTNGSTDNHVVNNDARATGDDAFALFSAIDAGGADETGNVFENLSSSLTWRAASLAVYGGYGNTFRNIAIADTLVYAGITISSLDFGIPMNGFGATPPTVFDNISIVRAGGQFYGTQKFPGIWLFSASKVFQGIRVSNVDIVNPTYSGVMFQTNYVGNTPQNPVTDTAFDTVSVSGAPQAGILVLPGAVGSASFTNLRFTGNAEDIENTTSTFQLNTSLGQPPTTAPASTAPATTAPSTVDLAAGRPVTDSGHADIYRGANVVDGNPSTYWEGPRSFPATLTVDLGSTQPVGKVSLALPPVAAWGRRTQEIVVLGSTDGSSYSTLAGEKAYTFDPATGNGTSATFDASRVRYVRLEFRSNTAWPAGQLADLGVFAG